MKAGSILLQALFCGVASQAHAAPDELRIEFMLDADQAAVDATRVVRAIERSGQSPALGSDNPTRLLGSSFRWTANRRMNLESTFELRTSFMLGRDATDLTAEQLQASVETLAATPVRANLSARLTAGPLGFSLSPPGCVRHSEHPDGEPAVTQGGRGVPLILTLSVARATITRVPPRRENMFSKRPKKVLVYEFVWSGRFKIPANLSQRVKLFRNLWGWVRVTPVLDDEFENALASMVIESVKLLNGAYLERTPAEPVKRDAPATGGLTGALLPTGDDNSVRMARQRLQRGDLTLAKATLKAALAQGTSSPQTKALAVEIHRKLEMRTIILSKSRDLRRNGEAAASRWLIESYYYADDGAWVNSSQMEVEHARTLLALGLPELARAQLHQARKRTPSLWGHWEFKSLWGATTPVQ